MANWWNFIKPTLTELKASMKLRKISKKRVNNGKRRAWISE